jgi:hypothetical protein
MKAAIPAPGQHLPELAATYIGIAADTDGGTARHVIMLDALPPTPSMTWAKGVKWAASLGNGARLATRHEMSLAFSNAKIMFEPQWYWTGTQSSRNVAFVQGFEGGGAYWSFKDDERRVRAFRGLPLEHFNTSTPAQVVADADAAPGGAEGAGANFLASAGVAA